MPCYWRGNGKSKQCIEDTYLAYRVHQLIQQGKLSYQGNL
ncbi:DUF3658 domain-containing protein [Bacillus paramycoides]|nr:MULTISPECIES: DUF3658 domain-containing protein [Bacillus]MED1412513.1 DUF3658 domain-containing protein [Bacillus paramycoides]MED1463823.1 DUF3658 domain-containing protein [Bacillus paramycoides]MED1495420.1 DUF3658 domain-containing protein [Bacillus paramycoides]